MANFINSFSTTKPVGTDLASGIDGYILDDTKKSLNERLSLEHNPLNSTEISATDPASSSAQGRHIPGQVGVLLVGLLSEIMAITTNSGGQIAYATDNNNFYHWVTSTGWQILTLSSETIGVEATLRIISGGSGNVLEMNHDHHQWTSPTGLTDGANIATDCTQGNSFTVTLGGDRTLTNPTGEESGATYIWVITQDATGSRQLFFGADFLFPGGVAPVMSTGIGAVDLITALCIGSKFYCSVMYDVKATS